MNRLRVLTYHRIASPVAIRPYDPKLVSATPEDFERQMAWLSAHYSVIDLDGLLDAIDRKTRLPRKAVLITFDDAYPDFRTTAWPILKAWRLPATLFVPTAYPDRPHTPFWWDELNARFARSERTQVTIEPFGPLSLETERDRLKALGDIRAHVKTLNHRDAMTWLEEIYSELETEQPDITSTMTWDELRSLSAEGVSIAAHSRSHPLLTRIPPEALDDEIAGARADVEREIGRAPPVFCYPAGACNRSVEDAAQRAGMRLAFTTRTGHNDLDRCRPLALRRLNVTPRTTLNVLRIKLSVPGAYADRLRKRLA